MPTVMNTDAPSFAAGDALDRGARARPLARLRSVHGRAQLVSLVEAELAVCRRSEARLALMMLDTQVRHVDGRAVEAVSPALWEAVAMRLVRRVRSTDVVLRLSASRYAVLLHGAGRREAEVVRTTLTRALTERYELPGGPLALDLVVAVGTYLDRRDTAGDLVAIAEAQLPRT